VIGIRRCKEILGAYGCGLTDAQVGSIRDGSYVLASIIVEDAFTTAGSETATQKPACQEDTISSQRTPAADPEERTDATLCHPATQEV
jgi:hypothetical protein